MKANGFKNCVFCGRLIHENTNLRVNGVGCFCSIDCLTKEFETSVRKSRLMRAGTNVFIADMNMFVKSAIDELENDLTNTERALDGMSGKDPEYGNLTGRSDGISAALNILAKISYSSGDADRKRE